MRRRIMPWLVILFLGVAYSIPALAGKSSAAAPLGSTDLQKPLEVKGQTRNVSMMVINQAEKDKLKFVTARKDFRDQILSTKY